MTVHGIDDDGDWLDGGRHPRFSVGDLSVVKKDARRQLATDPMD